MKETYLVFDISDDDVVFIEESDSFFELKKTYEEDSNVLIAKAVWKSEGPKEPETFPVPEGDCLDGLLDVQED